MPSPTVVVVDSDVSALATAADVLRKAGYHVSAVATFSKARDLLDRAQPDVLIADIRLDTFNGLHLVLHRRLNDPSSVAIVTNSYRDSVLEEEARQLGATYLVKPIDPDILLAEVARLLGSAPAGDPSPERRRSRRSVVSDRIEVAIGRTRARLVDVSYGGFQLAVADTTVRVPDMFVLRPPGESLVVRARSVWNHYKPDAGVVGWGAALIEESGDSALAWRAYVDRCAT